MYQVIRGIYQALLEERDNDDYDVEDDKEGDRYDEDVDSDDDDDDEQALPSHV